MPIAHTIRTKTGKTRKVKLTPLSAIRAFCLECVCWSAEGVRECTGHVAHLVRYFGNRPLNQFEKDEQSRYRAWRKRQTVKYPFGNKQKKQTVTEATIDKEIITLSAMFHEAMKAKKIPPECMPGQFLRLDLYNPRRCVTDEEFEKILHYTNDAFKDVLICAYESAMRAGEIINLRAGQVHLDVKHISGEILDYLDLGIFDTKSGARRTVPVSRKLKVILQKRLQGLNLDDHVFTNSRGRPYPHSQSFSNNMRYACQNVGVPYGDKLMNGKGERIGVVFHSLRHTRTTKWVEQGWSDELIRRATGHKSLDSYRKYVNITDARPIMKLVKNEKRIIPDNLARSAV